MLLRFYNLSRKYLLYNQVRGYIARNEPVLHYKIGSSERTILEAELNYQLKNKPFQIPICIGTTKFIGSQKQKQVLPFNHKSVLSTFDYATKEQINQAIEIAIQVREKWSRVPFEKRADILLRAADLVSNKYRSKLLASTILGQGKTIFQAEIDAVAELADFFRFNELLKYKPLDGLDCENKSLFRPMEGFWAAIPPFNFTAIAGNLATAPVLMGNTVLWKPSDTAVLSNYITYELLIEAGIPEGVINFLPAHGPTFGDVVTSHKNLAGINFTGSTNTYREILKTVYNKIHIYRGYPKTIGECGGKNFHFLHPSADLEEAAIGTIRSSFEYSGQKCSACSRIYVPKSTWNKFKELLLTHHKKLKISSPLEKECFTSAVIDKIASVYLIFINFYKAFTKIKSYIEYAKSNSNIKIIAGGKCDDSVGYFIEPTILLTEDPTDKLMTDDIFGPVVTVYVYDDKNISKALDLVDSTSDYALTGSIFAKDDDFLRKATDRLIDCSGNLYLNAQSTGSIVGQQPFGGSRLSGTNDKAGGPYYVGKFVSPLSIKTQKLPIASWHQAHME